MKKIFLFFFIISIVSFANNEEALKNTLDRLYMNKNEINFDIRTAKALFQPEETIVTIFYKGEEKSGYAANVNLGDEYSCKVTLFEGYEYAIVGAGDNSAIDVDIFVYDPEGNTVAFDRTTYPTAYAKLPKDFLLNKSVTIDTSIADTETSIRPLVTQKYTVKLKLRESKNQNSSVAFIVATKQLK